MSSFMGKMAVGNVERQIRGELDSTISSFGGAFRARSERSNDPPPIDWTNFNYPPLLRIIHYDITELPTPVAMIVKFIHWSFLVGIVVLVLNFIDSIVLAVGGAGWLRVLYSLLNFVIVTPAAGYVFYQGYRALATSSPTYNTRYLICQGIMACFHLLFILAPLGAINGLAKFAVLNKLVKNLKISGGMRAFWIFAITAESVGWGIALGFGLFGMYKAWRFNPYHSQQARSQGIP